MKRLLGLLAAMLVLAGCGGGLQPLGHSQQPFGGPSYRSHTFGAPPANAQPPGVTLGATQTVLMLDSVDPISVFSGLHYTALAGYLHPSSWPTYYEYAGHAKYVVAVAVQAFVHGQRGAAITCLDVEPGDAAPSQAGPWLKYEVAHGFRPCVYSSLSTFPAINASIAASHVPGHVYRWCAEWTDAYHLVPGCDATQWTSHYDGRNIDGDAATLAFLNAVPTPPPAPALPRCYHHGWAQPRTRANEATCNRVRKHDSYLGVVVKHEDGYLAVTNRNVAALSREIARLKAVRGADIRRHTTELRSRAKAAAALNTDLHKYGFF